MRKRNMTNHPKGSAKKEKTEMEKKEVGYGIRMRLAAKKNAWITNLVNARYYVARCNMMVDQMNGEITEKIDGTLKTKELMWAEYAKMKLMGIKFYRDEHFAKKDLMEEFKMTPEDIKAFEDDLYKKKIIREDHDEGFRQISKARYVQSDDD